MISGAKLLLICITAVICCFLIACGLSDMGGKK